MSVQPVCEQALVAQRTPHGRRLAFYGRSADAAYWDELWERLPADYSRARRGHLPRQLRKTFRRFAEPGGLVLEAGCGQAHFSVAAAASGFRVEAVDWAARTVERLRSTAPEVNARAGDVRRLDCPDGYYDAVYSRGVCEHFEAGPEQVLAETYRVLKPGGVAIVSTPCFNPLLRMLVAGPFGLTHRGGPTPGLAFHQYAFAPATLSAALRDCGFEVVAVRPYGALGTLLDYTAAGRWLPARVPRRALFPLEGAMELAGLPRLLGRGCVWVARRPAGSWPPAQRRVTTRTTAMLSEAK